MSKFKKDRMLGNLSFSLPLTFNSLLFASALCLAPYAMAEDSAEATSKLTYHISSGSLNQALTQFAGAAGILLSVDARLTDGKTSLGLNGDYSVEEGFQKLLAGSGLTYKFINKNTVTLQVAETQSQTETTTLPKVKVTANRVDPVTEEGPGLGYVARNSDIGTKMNIPLMELPQAAQVITKQVIQDQGITNINDVLKNVSGYAPNNTFNQHDSSFKIRGFDVGPLRDGEPTTYGFGYSGSRDLMVNFERIEVLKGPAAIAYGASQAGDLGGIINLVSKMPLETARYQFSSQTDQYGYESPSIDATGPLNEAKTVLYRFTAQSLHRGSYTDNYQQDSWGVFPSITFTNKVDTDLTLKAEYQIKRANFYTGLPAYGTLIGPNLNYPIGRNFQDPATPIHDEPNLVTTATLNHKFNSDWSVKTVFRFFQGESKYGGYLSPTYLNPDGYIGGLTDPLTLLRQSYFYNEKDRDLMGDVQLHGNVSFFNTEHKLLFGVQHLSYEGITHAAYGDINTINLLNPQYGATPSGLIFGNGYNDKSDYTGIYFQDHLALTSKLKLLLGTRYSIITDNIHAGGGTSDYKVTVTEPTPSVGITYALTDFMNVYSSYSRGIQPAGGPFFPGSQPQPQQSRQYEIGSKFDFHQGLTANIAFFNIVKQHYTVGDPNNPGYNIQIGEVTSQGTEANAIWAIPDTGWTITGTYGYTDAKVTKDTAQDNDVGNYLTNVPHNSGRLWSMYRFPENSMLSGFRVGGGMYAVDARQATLPNTFLLPGYASFDAMLGYAFKHYDVALNLQNLTDHRIYESTGAYNEGVFPGTPFTAVLSLRTTW